MPATLISTPEPLKLGQEVYCPEPFIVVSEIPRELFEAAIGMQNHPDTLSFSMVDYTPETTATRTLNPPEIPNDCKYFYRVQPRVKNTGE